MRTYDYMDCGPGERGYRVWLREDGLSVANFGADTLGEVYRIGAAWKRQDVVPQPRPVPGLLAARPTPRVTLRTRLAGLLSLITTRA